MPNNVDGTQIVLIILVFGAIGGLVAELISLEGRIERPHHTQADELRTKIELATAPFMYDLGILARLIIGIVAAFAVVSVTLPTTVLALVASSAIAGSAGTSIIRSLQSKQEAALAFEKADTAEKKVEEIRSNISTALKAATDSLNEANNRLIERGQLVGDAQEISANVQRAIIKVSEAMGSVVPSQH